MKFPSKGQRYEINYTYHSGFNSIDQSRLRRGTNAAYLSEEVQEMQHYCKSDKIFPSPRLWDDPVPLPGGIRAAINISILQVSFNQTS